MVQRLEFSTEQWEMMISHLEECLPEEGCGLIGGNLERVKVVFPITNDSHSAIRFRMDPIEQLEKMRWIEDHQMDMIGIFHSHPDGPSYPSQTDINEFAYPGVINIILYRVNNRWSAKGFLIQETNVKEVPLTIVFSS